MKIRGAHVVVLVAAAVIGLLVYGGAKMAGNATVNDTDGEQVLEEIRQTAPVDPSTEAGTVPPMAQATTEAPKIEMEPAGDINMGTIRNDGNTTLEIKVHNKGNAPLKITRITTGCGCTQAKMEEKDKTIAPGAFSPLSVTVNPAKIASGFESRKSVTLNTNDPAMPTLKFDVIVKVNPEYLLEPAKVEFGIVEKGTPQEKVILFRQLSDYPIEIKSLSSTIPRWKSLDITHELRPKDQWLDANKSEYNIKVKLADNIPLGPYNGRFTILTTCKRRSEVPVSVTATLKSWYSISPARMLVLRQVPGAPENELAKAIVAADRPFEITDIQPSIEGIKFEVKPGEKENSRVINLSLEPDAKPRGRIEYLNFTVKSGEEAMKEQLEVRVIPTGAPGAARPEGARPLINRPKAKLNRPGGLGLQNLPPPPVPPAPAEPAAPAPAVPAAPEAVPAPAPAPAQ